MLIGEYTHSQDDKKRISLPIKFRKEIGKKVVITHGLDNCLFMFSMKEWSKIAEQLGSLSMGQAGSRGFNRIILGGAVEVDVDGAGRILIPDFLREYAGISDRVTTDKVAEKMLDKTADKTADKAADKVSVEKSGKVVFTGVHNKVEIWDEARWKNYKSDILKQADSLAEKLGELGVI